jgi:hypothetical protein
MTPGKKRYTKRVRAGAGGKKRQALAEHLFIHFGGKCWWCKCDVVKVNENLITRLPNQATVDHLKTLRDGRENYFDGGHVLACYTCNTNRGREEDKKYVDFQRGLLKLNIPDKPVDLQRAVNYSSLLLTKGLR